MPTPKSSTYIEGIGWRYTSDNSKLHRMEGHDYQSRCIYMLTLTLANRSEPILGSLSWKEEQPTFTHTPLGLLVAGEWEQLSHEVPQLSIINLQLMPDHLHVVIYVREHIDKPLGKYVGIYKNRCNKHYWQQLTAQGLLAPKGEETPPPLFSTGFQDTILTDGGQLSAMLRYVTDNPYRALVKHDNPDLFTVVSDLEVDGIRFAAIGNRWLLDRAVKMQVRCHNNDSQYNLRLIALQKEYFLQRAAKGGVVVSPCISAGEKEIAHAVLDAHHPLIVILENGFPPIYKPPGKYFEACAAGLLLMLAPWPYHSDKRVITRQQCLELNDMAHAISSEPWSDDMEAKLTGASQPSCDERNA